MYQQINLYQPVFRRQRKVFSAHTLLQIIAIATIVLAGFYAHAKLTLNGLNSTVTSLSTQHRQLEARLGILESSGTAITVDARTEMQLLEQAISDRKRLLTEFSQLEFRDSAAFSEFFEILATRTIPGLWLTGIRLYEDGETEIRGATLNPTLVPRYLQGMPDQPRFSALHKGSIQLSRPDTSSTDVSFILSSINGEEL